MFLREIEKKCNEICFSPFRKISYLIISKLKQLILIALLTFDSNTKFKR